MNKIGIIGAMETEVALIKESMQKSGAMKETSAGGLVFFEGNIGGTNVVAVKGERRTLRTESYNPIWGYAHNKHRNRGRYGR